MRAISIVMMIAFCAGMGEAQTTRPAGETPPQWERVVSSLTAAVVGHDSQTVQSLVGEGCRVGRFFAQPDGDSSAFVDAISADTVLGDHAYVQPAAAIAGDIAHDVNSSSVVPDFEKHSFNLDDKHSRTVASQLVTQALNVGDGEFVGLIVLWDTRADVDDQHRLIFVLVKGEGDGDGFRLTRVVYGDPLQ